MKKNEQTNCSLYDSVNMLLDLDLDESVSGEVFECILNAENTDELDILKNGLNKLLDKKF